MSKRAAALSGTITVKRSESDPENVELIAKSIIEMADAFQRLLKSGLTERAMILLINDLVPGRAVGMNEIAAVLKALPRLREYVKRP